MAILKLRKAGLAAGGVLEEERVDGLVRVADAGAPPRVSVRAVHLAAELQGAADRGHELKEEEKERLLDHESDHVRKHGSM